MVSPNQWFFLLKLAELGAVERWVFTSTTSLAMELGCSQQTASRLLRKLSLDGYVERRMNFRGEHVKITENGIMELRKIHDTLTLTLHPRRPSYLTIQGRLFTGLGEGAYYITREGYWKQLVNKLGFKPYPGTLNLKVSTSTGMVTRRELEKLPGIIIDGFSDGQRTFGTLKCIPALINDKIRGAVLLIQRTHHNSSVIEIIAPVYLREALKIKDNDLVNVKILP